MADPAKRQRVGSPVPAGVDIEGPELDGLLANVLQQQEQLDKLLDEANEKVLAVEQEYSKKRRPVYKKRGALISNIPDFWSMALHRHPQLNQMITEADLDVLRYCTELDVEDFDDIKEGYTITFTFKADNPYFSNSRVSKILADWKCQNANAVSMCQHTIAHPVQEFRYSDENALDIKATAIQWKPGMEPEGHPVPGSTKRPRNSYNFMMWFADESLEPGQHDDVADIIKDEIWPSPVRFYTGTALEEAEELAIDEDEDEDGEGQAAVDDVGDDEELPDEGYEGEGGLEVDNDSEVLEGDVEVPVDEEDEGIEVLDEEGDVVEVQDDEEGDE